MRSKYTLYIYLLFHIIILKLYCIISLPVQLSLLIVCVKFSINLISCLKNSCILKSSTIQKNEGVSTLKEDVVNASKCKYTVQGFSQSVRMYTVYRVSHKEYDFDDDCRKLSKSTYISTVLCHTKKCIFAIYIFFLNRIARQNQMYIHCVHNVHN